MTSEQFIEAIAKEMDADGLRAVMERFEPTFRALSNEDKRKPRDAWKARQRELNIKV